MIKRKSWQDYQKEIADDHYYYARSCIRQNFFPGSEKLFIDMLRNDLGKDLTDDPLHSSCTDRKSTRLNSSHRCTSRMPSSA